MRTRLSRDQGLIKAHGVSQEELERDQENLRNAEAGVRQARATLAATEAGVQGTTPQTHPRVLQAEGSLRSNWLASSAARVSSPLYPDMSCDARCSWVNRSTRARK